MQKTNKWGYFLVLLALDSLMGTSVNPWKVSNFYRSQYALKIGLILINIAAAAVLALLIVFLFSRLTGTADIRILGSTPSICAVGLSTAIFLAVQFLWSNIFLTRIMTQWNLGNIRSLAGSVAYLFLSGLAYELPRVLFVCVTVVLWTKFTGASFAFRWRSFWPALAVILIAYLLYAYVEYLPLEASQNGNVVFDDTAKIGIFNIHGLSITDVQFNFILKIIQNLLSTCVDWIFLSAFHCKKAECRQEKFIQ